MKNSSILLLGLMVSLFAHSQQVFFLVNDGAVLTNSAQIVVLGEFENQGSVSNSNALTVTENYFDLGTYSGPGWVHLDGTAYSEVEIANTIEKLSINKPGTTIESHADILCSTTFSLVDGKVNLAGNELVVGNPDTPANVSGGDASSFVHNGDITLHFYSNINLRFPIGTDTGIPVDVNVGITDTLAHWITLSATNSTHPDMPTSFNYLDQHWSVSHSIWDEVQCDIVVQYDENKIVGDESLVDLEQWSGASWTGPSGSGSDTEIGTSVLDQVANTITWLDINSIADLAIFSREQACAGDFNNDQMVNTSDLLFLLSQMSCVSMCESDLNNDGFVNTSDLLILLSVFGTSCL